MRIVLIGAGNLAVATAHLLLEHSHEVVIVEQSEERIEALSDRLDCGFLVGDGSRPSVLREVSPENTDFLFCLAGSDQDNIIAALVGRKLGFKRIVVHLDDAEFQSICTELDIDETVIPDREVGRALADLVEGEYHADLFAVVKEGVRFLAFTVAAEMAGPASALDLPEDVHAAVVTRGDTSRPARPETALQEGDEVLLVVAEERLTEVQERFKVRKPRMRRST
jgi:trk system potassium uptake protein TrkA